MFLPTIAVQVNDLGAFRLHRGDTATTRIGPVLVVVALIVLKLVPNPAIDRESSKSVGVRD